MRLLSLLCIPFSAPTLTLGQSYDYGVDERKLLRRQSDSGPSTVQRLPNMNGSVPLRMEIRDMKADSYKWDIYMLSLSMFQYVGQDDPLSYYGIAGIHGVPFKAWNDVDANPPGSPTPQAGYCPHSSVLFPTWHRPYLVLFEQELYKLANAIAPLFNNATERQLYQQAAAEFRIPYWDWSIAAPSGESHFPDVFWSPVIAQKGPNGVQRIRNPLYSYRFHPLDSDAMVWEPLKEWNETKRAPDTAVSSTDPPSRNEQVNAALLSKLPNIQQRLYILFSSYHDWNSFSNKAWAVSQNLSAVDSIEAVHDIIHMYGGSKGHFTYVPLSSFDPLFFLHHAMTDRLVAMWQILNPDAWMQPMASGEKTFTTPKGTVQSSNTPLSPFLATKNGMFWDSDMSRTTEAFGYAYADTLQPADTREGQQKRLMQKITEWWGSSSPMGMLLKTWRPSRRNGNLRWTVSSHQRTAQSHEVRFRPDVSAKAQNPSVSKIIKNGHYTEWVANVHAHAEALDGSFGVHFFVGDVPADAGQWESAINHIGTVVMFAMNQTTGSQSKISGSLPLTSALMKMVAAGMVHNLDPESVVPYVQTELSVATLGSNGKPVSLDLVGGLYVGISSSDVALPDSDWSLPVWTRPVVQLTLWPKAR